MQKGQIQGIKAREAKDNSKFSSLNIWKDQVLTYEIEKTVVGAGLQWEPKFGFGCVKFVS